MKYACRYAIVRFMPYPETGEFANVGVVLMSPEARFFSYRFNERRVARVHAFFDELDPNIYQKAQDLFTQELTRIRGAIERRFAAFDQSSNEIKYLNMLFDELARPREGIMYLDDPRVILAEDPAKTLDGLFETYVHRAFMKNANYEKELENRIKAVLAAAHLEPMFHEKMFGNDFLKARFPFVRLDRANQPRKVIKALNLCQTNPGVLYKYGSDWVGKVRSLRRTQMLPNDILFAVEGPTEKFSATASAFAEIKAELAELDVMVVAANEVDQIVSFARH